MYMYICMNWQVKRFRYARKQNLHSGTRLAQLARSKGIHAALWSHMAEVDAFSPQLGMCNGAEVLGGHDHTEYIDQHKGCVLLKTGD